jgi:peptidoglycan/LPS O-acetylase OafA/YrhL
VKGNSISFLPSGGNRSQTLDILRFVAVALVLMRHAWICTPEISPWLHSVTKVLHRGGWIGVDLFFVLSGFLISGLLFKECQSRGDISLRRFFVRRGFKIYPPFWALMFFTVVLELMLYKKIEGRWLLCELLFVQNYGPSSQWVYTWSLAVEEHFYIFLPVLLVVLLKFASTQSRPFGRIPLIFGVIAGLCLGIRVMGAASGAFSCKANLGPTHLRIDSLFFGVLLSFFYHYHRTAFTRLAQRYAWLWRGLGCALLLPAFLFDLATTPYIYTVGFTQFYLGSGLLLVGFLGRSATPGPLHQCLAFIGSRSYSIYLWHGPVAWLASERFLATANFLNWYGWTITFLGGALLVGVVMAALIEYPALGLRDRWLPSCGRPVDLAPQATQPTLPAPNGCLGMLAKPSLPSLPG